MRAERAFFEVVRLSFREYRDNATCEDEAHLMRDAGEIIRRALADQAYAPR